MTITSEQLAACGSESGEQEHRHNKNNNRPDKWEIISQSDAKNKKLKYYFTGDPCKRGHIDLRFTASMTCVSCGRIRSKEFYRRTVLRYAEDRRQKYYGMSHDDVELEKKKQNNKCSICGNEFKDKNGEHVDHDHKTGLYRALLCRGCNTGLGNFKESISNLERAIEYLRKHNDSSRTDSW